MRLWILLIPPIPQPPQSINSPLLAPSLSRPPLEKLLFALSSLIFPPASDEKKVLLARPLSFHSFPVFSLPVQ